MKILPKIALASTLLLGATEVAVRVSGAVDFPLYFKDSGIGYALKPNQNGAFMGKNQWVYNDRSMGVEQDWNPSGKINLLILGNSIVMGGNPYNQPEKLGPLLQQKLGEKIKVWPAAVGGWTNVNEVEYLRRNPDVVKGTNFFIWEYMNGGFSQLSTDRGEYVWPTRKPTCATCYVARKYVLPRFINLDPDELPPKGNSQAENIALFEAQVSALSKASGAITPGIIFMYPGRDEYIGFKSGKDYAPDRKALERIAKTYNLKLIDVAQSVEWNINMYREGTHPTVEGNRVLAGILALAVKNAVGSI